MAITQAPVDGYVNGDIPQINRNAPRSYVHLYTHGFPNASTMFGSVKMKKGYGLVEAGTLLAEDAKGEFVPYVKTTYSDDVATSPLLANAVYTESTVKVIEAEAYKYAVGDVLILANDDPLYFDGGAITDITIANGQATITFTNAIDSAEYTVAKNAHVYVKTGTSGKFSTAVGILDKNVDTGYGSAALGGQGSIVFKNAEMYEPALANLDDAAKTALSIGVFGKVARI